MPYFKSTPTKVVLGFLSSFDKSELMHASSDLLLSGIDKSIDAPCSRFVVKMRFTLGCLHLKAIFPYFSISN